MGFRSAFFDQAIFDGDRVVGGEGKLSFFRVGGNEVTIGISCPAVRRLVSSLVEPLASRYKFIGVHSTETTEEAFKKSEHYAELQDPWWLQKRLENFLNDANQDWKDGDLSGRMVPPKKRSMPISSSAMQGVSAGMLLGVLDDLAAGGAEEEVEEPVPKRARVEKD